jgi:hypothetical protein
MLVNLNGNVIPRYQITKALRYRMSENHDQHEHAPHEGERVTFTIRIDRAEFRVHEHMLTGRQLRHLPHPPIGPDRDLFEVIPGGSDRKIEENEEVRMREHLRFFTAPAQINPGRVGVHKYAAAG